MITKIDEKTVQELIYLYGDNIYTMKIQTLLDAYGGYDFCGFFAGRGVLVSKYYSDFVIAANGEPSDDEIIEIAQFLQLSGYNVILCENTLGQRIFEHFEKICCFNYVSNLMKYTRSDDFSDAEKIEENPPLDSVYEILKTAFKIDYETWYVDTSHRIRHGISKAYIYDKISTATLAFDIRNICFLSLVGTKSDERKRGSATKMLKTLCGAYKFENKATYLICMDERLHFYENAGFERIGRVFNIRRNGVH